MIHRSTWAHVIVAVATITWAFPAKAHDLWITPPPHVATGDLVSIDVLLGHGEDSVEIVTRDARRIVSLIAHAPNGDVVELPGLDGSKTFGVLRPMSEGAWIVGYESRPFVHRLGAERFRSHLIEEGLDEIAEIRRDSGTNDTPGIEWISRSVKTLFTVDGEPLVDRPIGLPVEIVAEALPSETTSDLVLRVEAHGAAISGALVDLRQLNGNAVREPRRTDHNGRVRFVIGPGAWLANVVISRSLLDGEEGADRADWRTIFASWSAVLP